jgi:hypothetical protein
MQSKGARSLELVLNPAEGEGFEPSVPFGTHAFQACALDRYATPPKQIYFSLNTELPQRCDSLIDRRMGHKKTVPPSDSGALERIVEPEMRG